MQLPLGMRAASVMAFLQSANLDERMFNPFGAGAPQSGGVFKERYVATARLTRVGQGSLPKGSDRYVVHAVALYAAMRQRDHLPLERTDNSTPFPLS